LSFLASFLFAFLAVRGRAFVALKSEFLRFIASVALRFYQPKATTFVLFFVAHLSLQRWCPCLLRFLLFCFGVLFACLIETVAPTIGPLAEPNRSVSPSVPAFSIAFAISVAKTFEQIFSQMHLNAIILGNTSRVFMFSRTSSRNYSRTSIRSFFT
jgi:hypothetical protein